MHHVNLSYTNLGKKTIAQAKSLGFSVVGFTDGEELAEARDILLQRHQEGNLSPFLGSKVVERANPKEFFPNVQSIILVAKAYPKPPEPANSSGGAHVPELLGQIAASGAGRDYHLELGEGLEQLGNWLGVAHQVFVDSKPILERALFDKAGLGYFGKNCTMIIPGQGSYFWLGGIATNLPLEQLVETKQLAEHHEKRQYAQEDKAGGYADKCGTCSRCIEACPTGALDPYHLNAKLCIAQLTQNKGLIPREDRGGMGTYLYGCDICQQVCPHNALESAIETVSEAKPELGYHLDLLDILTLTNGQFKEQFGDTAFGWRGRTVLQRNAVIALGNLQDKRALPSLMNLLADERPIIRATAAWAIGAIGYEGDVEVGNLLTQARTKEKDPHVLLELEWALEQLD